MNEEALDTPELERGRFSVLIANVGEGWGGGESTWVCGGNRHRGSGSSHRNTLAWCPAHHGYREEHSIQLKAKHFSSVLRSSLTPVEINWHPKTQSWTCSPSGEGVVTIKWTYASHATAIWACRALPTVSNCQRQICFKKVKKALFLWAVSHAAGKVRKAFDYCGEKPFEPLLIVSTETGHPSSELKCLVGWPAPETTELPTWNVFIDIKFGPRVSGMVPLQRSL